MITYSSIGHMGRLGNQLFEFAATIGTAIKNDMPYMFRPWYYNQFLQNPIPTDKNLKVPAKRFREQHYYYQDIRLTEPTDLVGFFQSEKYFKHCESLIRYHFELRHDLRDYLKKKYKRMLDQKPCSLHVRLTDYLVRGNFANLTKDYYKKAIRHVTEHFNNDPIFLIFSDDIKLAKRLYRSKRFVYIHEELDILDMFLMSMCDSHIIANSSFSWWGAWLANNQKVVAPERWYKGRKMNPNVPFIKGGWHEMRDLRPEPWVIID